MEQNNRKIAAPASPLSKACKSSGWKKYLFVALGLLIVAIILMFINMKLLFRLVSVLGIALTIGSIIVMLLTYRKSREITPKTMYISIGMSVAGLLVYSLFLTSNPGMTVWLLGLIIGTVAGVGWSFITPLFREGSAVKRAGNIWYLAVWGAIFVLNQFLIMVIGRTPTLAMTLLIFGTGLVIGNSGAYIVGYYKIKAEG